MSVISRAIAAENEAIAARSLEADIADALDAAQIAIDEYYNGDRERAAGWLLKAFAANKAVSK